MNNTPPRLTKKWIIAQPPPQEAGTTLERFPTFLRNILYNRGYTTYEAARRFLEGQAPKGTEPENLLGVAPSVERIQRALEKGEPIAVYGDYDVDGVTATALLTQALDALGANVQNYIPNRFTEGYGLNFNALETLHHREVKLLITVDCGTRSLDEIEHANQLGIDTIITDHHGPGPELPPAYAIINPKQPGDTYPDKQLAGVGLAFKLASALIKHFIQENPNQTSYPLEIDFLDLVALGTVADLAPLKGENRMLVRQGLEYIRRPHRQGLMSLIGVAGLSPSQITAEHIGFALGPRLNAAGRLGSAMDALKLLTTQDVKEAGYLAQLLDTMNRRRQKITRETQEHAEQLVLDDDPDALLLIAADSSYNAGVVGLAASRLTEKYYRPAIVAHQGEEFTRGSCRSISEFHITNALDQCADILVQHGGHAAAAGFTVNNDNFPELKERLQAIAHKELATQDLHPTLHADAEIPLSELTVDLLKALAWLEPTGQENPKVVFVTRDVKVHSRRTVGKDKSHLKLVVTDGKTYHDAIAFRQGFWQDIWKDQKPPRVDLLYKFELNEFNGRSRLQLNVIDIKPSGSKD